MFLHIELRTKVADRYAVVSSSAAPATQRRLHLHGLQMVILPMKI
jgi:hypothetical protein